MTQACGSSAHSHNPHTDEDPDSPFSSATRHSNVLYVQRVVSEAVLPQRQTAGSAGYDLVSVEEVISLQPGERTCVSTGLRVAIPEGYYGRVAPRSGLAAKNGIHVGAGVIDSDYRGTLMVLVFNLGRDPVTLPSGSRVAQLIIEKISTPCVVEIPLMKDLPGTSKRGQGGFGSTGQ